MLAILPAAFGQRFSFGIIGGGVATGGPDPSAQDVWEGKRYTFGPTGALHPFVAGGAAIEWVRPETHLGAVAGAGVEFRVGRMRFAPAFRYTRWSGRYWDAYGSHGYFTGSNLDQAEALFTVLF